MTSENTPQPSGRASTPTLIVLCVWVALLIAFASYISIEQPAIFFEYGALGFFLMVGIALGSLAILMLPLRLIRKRRER